jgi:hypothetical protein
MGAFEIVVHKMERLLEVIYPERPDGADIADYSRRVKQSIDELGPGWDCLVDQRRLKLLAPELLDKVAALNAYAERHGMRRSARIVATAVAELQAARMVREAALQATVKSFSSREAALAWLREEAEGDPGMDARINTRADERRPVRMWVELTHEGCRYFHHSADLSLGGIFLDHTIPHPAGTVVQLRFTLPGEQEAIELQAQVVAARDDELGIHLHFLDPSSSVRARIAACLARAPR